MAGGRGRRRGAAAPSTPRWMVLGFAGLIVLGLTFALGMLAGRHLTRQSQVAAATAAPAQKAAPRRSGLTEARVEHAPPIREKLTFYQTLTAPLGAVPPSVKADAPTKPMPPRARSSPDRPPEPTSTTKASADPDSPMPSSSGGRRIAPDGDRRDPGSEWTVQVGVFGSAEQAAGVKRQLAARGFDAQITSISSPDGQVRYRVRVGAFKTKDEAIHAADRVRADRSIPTYVTAAN